MMPGGHRTLSNNRHAHLADMLIVPKMFEIIKMRQAPPALSAKTAKRNTAGFIQTCCKRYKDVGFRLRSTWPNG